MRYRFIDAVLAVDAHGAGTIRTAKAFPHSEDYLDGTFRPAGEVPASLVLEAMAAAGSLLLAVRARWRSHGVLLKIAQARCSRPVVAGDRLVVEATIRGLQDGEGGSVPEPAPGIARVGARGVVEGALVAEADFLFLAVPMQWSFVPRHH